MKPHAALVWSLWGSCLASPFGCPGDTKQSEDAMGSECHLCKRKSLYRKLLLLVVCVCDAKQLADDVRELMSWYWSIDINKLDFMSLSRQGKRDPKTLKKQTWCSDSSLFRLAPPRCPTRRRRPRRSAWTTRGPPSGATTEAAAQEVVGENIFRLKETIFQELRTWTPDCGGAKQKSREMQKILQLMQQYEVHSPSAFFWVFLAGAVAGLKHGFW